MKRLLFLISALISLSGMAQPTITYTTINGQNALVYQPSICNSGNACNCLYYFVGAGEQAQSGNTLAQNQALLTANGPGVYLKAGVDLKLPLIVVSLQAINANPRPTEVQADINALRAMFNVKGIVMTGISRGGQSIDWYISNTQNNINNLVGVATGSSEGPVSDEPGIAGTWTPAWFGKIPYWFCIGTQDPFYNANIARYTALQSAGDVAYLTVWPGAGHAAVPVWNDLYSLPGQAPDNVWKTNVVGTDLYTWAAGLGGSTVATPPVLTYSSPAVSQTFTRNNCPAGDTAGTVVYTVPAGKYTSTVSAAAVNAQAAADIAANGQAYANANGACKLPTMYPNAAQLGTFSRNNCACGTGTVVTYSVPAGKYSALTQAGANALAQADVTANGQAFANTTGICTPTLIMKWYIYSDGSAWKVSNGDSVYVKP
jgi:hypothetical protein